MSMNFSTILDALNQASAFELFRLRIAIQRKLDDPQWTHAIRSRLHVGQEVDYFSAAENTIRHARIDELRRKQAAVTDLADGRRWLVDYVTINVDGVDVHVREQVVKGLGRNEVAVGDTLGFIDREGRERSGIVRRLNDKTVTLQVGDQQWRVAYQLLHRVVDSITGAVVDLPAPTSLLLVAEQCRPSPAR
jgi:hypothetical protein